MPTQLLPQKLGITDACQWETEARDRNEEFVYGTGSFSHAFNFKSIHQEWEQSGVHNKVVSWLQYFQDDLIKIVEFIEPQILF